jgi:hypothetical protein
MSKSFRNLPSNFANTRARFGGPRRQATSRYENPSRYGVGTNFGSHMPLDANVHWDWRNPLNLIPAMVVLPLLAAVIGAIV